MTIIAHHYGITPAQYLTTRTRASFNRDAMAVLRSKLLPINIVTSLMSKAFSGSSSQSKEPLQAPRKQGEPASLQDATRMRRERNSSKPYPWLRRVSGRNYKVFNLDTRDPGEFKQATSMMGKSLARKVR